VERERRHFLVWNIASQCPYWRCLVFGLDHLFRFNVSPAQSSWSDCIVVVAAGCRPCCPRLCLYANVEDRHTHPCLCSNGRIRLTWVSVVRPHARFKLTILWDTTDPLLALVSSSWSAAIFRFVALVADIRTLQRCWRSYHSVYRAPWSERDLQPILYRTFILTAVDTVRKRSFRLTAVTMVLSNRYMAPVGYFLAAPENYIWHTSHVQCSLSICQNYSLWIRFLITPFSRNVNVLFFFRNKHNSALVFYRSIGLVCFIEFYNYTGQSIFFHMSASMSQKKSLLSIPSRCDKILLQAANIFAVFRLVEIAAYFWESIAPPWRLHS